MAKTEEMEADAQAADNETVLRECPLCSRHEYAPDVNGKWGCGNCGYGLGSRPTVPEGLVEEADQRLCFGSMTKHEVYLAGRNEALATLSPPSHDSGLADAIERTFNAMDNFLPGKGESWETCFKRRLLDELSYALRSNPAPDALREALASDDLDTDAQYSARITAQSRIWHAMKEAGYEPTPETVKVIRAAAFAGLRDALRTEGKPS